MTRRIPKGFHVDDDAYRARLLSRGMKNARGCLEYQGWRNHYGYGEMSYQNNCWIVTRLAWHLWVGPIPKGKLVLHHCDNPPCFNISHLFIGTRSDNTWDMVRKGRHHYTGRTHCKYGHEFTPENVYRAPSKPGKRQCRLCQRNRQRIKSGWTLELADAVGKVPHGYKVNRQTGMAERFLHTIRRGVQPNKGVGHE